VISILRVEELAKEEPNMKQSTNRALLYHWFFISSVVLATSSLQVLLFDHEDGGDTFL
jgi:hypothetical protein